MSIHFASSLKTEDAACYLLDQRSSERTLKHLFWCCLVAICKLWCLHIAVFVFWFLTHRAVSLCVSLWLRESQQLLNYFVAFRHCMVNIQFTNYDCSAAEHYRHYHFRMPISLFSFEIKILINPTRNWKLGTGRKAYIK